MAPPPFKIAADAPRPLTVRETARLYRVSKQTLDETLAAVAFVLKDGDVRRRSAKSGSVVNAAKKKTGAQAKKKAARARR